jgi:PPOX class probable F420-dependent enzyme
MLDITTEFGARVANRLTNEQIIWLTTVGPDQVPQPIPVWFLWDGERLLIFSTPNTPKLRNIAANPRVALNFDGDGFGRNIIVFNGQAVIGEQASADELATYSEKYQKGLDHLGWTFDSFMKKYSVPIRVTPTKLRGH